MIFGLFCVNFFKGALFYCFNNYESIPIDTKLDCLNAGGEWINRNLNFDNILNAMLLLFSNSITNYAYHMFIAIDSRGFDRVPMIDANPLWKLFYMISNIVFSFFLLNLFVGAVVSTFNEQREILSKN